MNLVDNSVQTQFAVLKKDTDAYRNAANAADRDRRREEEQLRVLQSSRIRLEEDIRVAHTELGTETRKKKILDDERKRLKDTMETDRQAIIKITSELKGIDADEKRQKINFVKEMESLNNELEFLLSQCENQKTLRLLDAETMNWMIETKLSQKVRSVQSDSDGPNVEDGSYFAEIEKWNVILSKTKNESEAFADAHQKHDASLKEKDELENLVHGLRIKFLAKNSSIGEIEIDDLEAKWEQHWDCEDPANSAMDLNENEDFPSGHSNNPTASVGATSVHMDLFYDANEFSEPLQSAHPSNNSQFAV